MFKICVIGCGSVATSGHGPSLLKYRDSHEDVCLAGCCDISPEKAKAYQEKFGFEAWYTDYATMLDEIKPDVVSLLCSSKMTKNLSIEVMKKGYNILLEKPPGNTLEEIEAMIDQAQKTKMFVRTAFNRRYTPLLAKLKEQLKGKRIFNITYQLYRHSKSKMDFSNTAVHAIDAVKYIAGSDYKRVDFTYQELPEIGDHISNYHLACTFENGAMAQISLIPMGGVTLERITVNTLDETYLAELPFWSNMDSPGRLRCIHKDKIILDITGDTLVDSTEMFEESGFYAEISSFFDLIRSGEPATCDLQTGVQSVDIADHLRTRKAVYEKN